MEKTHYRKAFNSPYLSSADIVEPTVLTISQVKLESDKSKKSKDLFNTAYFVEKEIRQGEKLKPMILNATNSRTLASLSGSKFIDDWQNLPVTVYVDSSVRFGRDTVEGLRISTEKPRTTLPPLVPGSKAWDNAKAAFQRDGNLNAVKKRMTITPDLELQLVGECQ
jgi:hypothetical protein